MQSTTNATKPSAFWLILGLASTAIGGCSSSIEDYPDAAPVQIEATLANIQEFIFTPACATSGCHDQTAAGGLRLTTIAESHASLVNVPAANRIASENGWLRVKPNDPELSFLVRKLTLPGLGEGSPMPITQKLTPLYQTLITDWIAAGAPQ